MEVDLPIELGKGISFPEQAVEIHLPGTEDRSPVLLGKEAVLYASVEKDASLIAVPTATGLETFSLLESSAASMSQTYSLELSPGAQLRQARGGGAEVVVDGDAILSVLPPRAVDAEGKTVPVRMRVEGSSLTIEVEPASEPTFPILVDPIYQTNSWSAGSTTGLSNWSSTSNASGYVPAAQLSCGTNCVAGETANIPGLYVGVNAGAASVGSTGYWTYYVPRYQSDKTTYGSPPTSFVSSVEFTNVRFFHRLDSAASPALFAGIWGGSEPPFFGGPNYWISQAAHYGNAGDWTNETINLVNGTSSKSAKSILIGMTATESRTLTSYRDAYAGGVKIGLSDAESPVLTGVSAPTEWVDQLAPIVPATAEDTGLGVTSFTSREAESTSPGWKYSLNCGGTATSPCPRIWHSSEGSSGLMFWPSVLAEGLDKVALTVADPVGNVSAPVYVNVKVDHSPPVVSLSGTLTESGLKRIAPGKYNLHIEATDGSEGNPRSGVKSVAIEVDGSTVPGTVEQSCPAGSCPATRDWTFDVNSYSNGEHIVKVKVKDQVGRQKISELKVTVDKSRLYWGAWIDGDVALMEGKAVRGDAPWDETTWNLFEQHAGKKVSIVHFGQPPPWINKFEPGPLNLAIQRGAIPMMDMRNDADDLPVHVSLAEIAQGKEDAAFKAWAEEVAAYKKPFFFRWDWEMNGNWFRWGREAEESPELYVKAWEHLHDLAESAGAKNLTWVWCPNVTGSATKPISPLFPKEAKYVDWTCLDGYNWGTNELQPDTWKSFKTVFGQSYEELLALAPSKPIMIGETASTEVGGSKGEWITDALNQIPVSFPKIKALVWFNWNDVKKTGRMDWPIESSEAAKSAFAAGIASSNYAEGGEEFKSLPSLAPIQPLP